MPKLVILWTDWAIYALVIGVLAYIGHVRRTPPLLANWRKVWSHGSAVSAGMVLIVLIAVALLDSIHFRPQLKRAAGAPTDAPVAYAAQTYSLLDMVLSTPMQAREKTYSAPLAYQAFRREPVERGETVVREFPRLLHGGLHLKSPEQEWKKDIAQLVLRGVVLGVFFAWGFALLCTAIQAHAEQSSLGQAWERMRRRQCDTPWHVIIGTAAVLSVLVAVTAALVPHYHVFGTDKTGNDVLYLILKSVRTALVMGTLATLAMLPLAISLGILAGYFKGWVDDAIQYIYTTLSSIPGVLLIAACVLMIQVFIDQHPDMFETGLERADLRLLLLCVILGVTGWASLCRLLRAETLKLRELDFVQAAETFGVSRFRIMTRHILPNVMHLVLITSVLQMSGIILYEAVLSYVGVGVDASTTSFGTLINLSRSEMAMDPPVWWTLTAAFFSMVGLVLAINVFADGVREAFDPRARLFRPRLASSARPAPVKG